MFKVPFVKRDFDKELRDALKACKVRAKQGRALAEESALALRQVINEAKREIKTNIATLRKGIVQDKETETGLLQQLEGIQNALDMTPDEVRDRIKALSKSTFTVTLFGRTMAGKSTLMEILTHGNGKSIGKGMQRTTRDVRSYAWKGLTIWDVPGVAAVDGKADEEVAYAAAAKGDLVLFLFKEPPQEQEAAAVSQVLRLGKPVIFLRNVPYGTDLSGQSTEEEANEELNILQEEMDEACSEENFKAFREQLLEYGKRYGQDWRPIPLIQVHLDAEWKSMCQEFRPWAKQLHQLSRFNYFRKRFSKIICELGPFYAFKSYVDAVSTPISDAVSRLFANSEQTRGQGELIDQKSSELAAWGKAFHKDVSNGIQSFAADVSQRLKRRARSFSEYHFKDEGEQATAAWKKEIEKARLEEEAQKAMHPFGEKLQNKMKDIFAELEVELKHFNKSFNDCRCDLPSFTDWGKLFRVWGITLEIEVAIGGLALWLGGSIALGPIGLALGAIGLAAGFFSWLCGSTDDANRNAQRKMEAKLCESIDAIANKLVEVLEKEAWEKCFAVSLGKVYNAFDKRKESLESLSDTQRELACRLNQQLRTLNKSYLDEALGFLNHWEVVPQIEMVTRVAGTSTILVLPTGYHFSEEVAFALTKLLQEHIHFVIQTDNLWSLLAQATWNKLEREQIPQEDIEIDTETHVARIPFLDELDDARWARVRMAQQLTELLITK